MNALFTQLLPIVSAVIGSGAFLAVFTDRRKRAAEAKKLVAEGGKVNIDGEVSIGGLSLQMSDTAVARMKAAEDAADAARKRADEAEARARVADDRLDAIEDRAKLLTKQLEDRSRELSRAYNDLRALRLDFDTMRDAVSACDAGHQCPVRDAILLTGPTHHGPTIPLWHEDETHGEPDS